jgi:hypothetical protein
LIRSKIPFYILFLMKEFKNKLKEESYIICYYMKKYILNFKITFHIKNICFLFVFLFIIISKTISQPYGRIKGSVRDSSNKESIPYAIIQVQGTKLGTSADVNGFYSLGNIPFGEPTLILSAAGFKTSKKKIKIDKEEPVLINFLLSPQPVILGGVTRTADRIRDIYKTNISVQSIGQQEINLVPIAVEKDLFRTVKVLPGITSTGDVTGQFYVRGGGGDQNMILYDNMIIYNPFHAFGLFSIFNTDAIKISEVFTGGIEPEYGGRLSSVINIISKEGNKNRFSGSASLGFLSGQALLEGPIYDGSFLFSFRKSFFHSILKKFLNKEVPLSFYDFSSKISYPFSEEGKFIFSNLSSYDEILNSDISEPDYFWKNNSFGLNLQTFLDKYLVNVSFSSSNFEAEVDYKDYKGLKNLKSKVNDFFFDSRIQIPAFQNDKLNFGLGFILPQMSFSLINNSGYYNERVGDKSDLNTWVRYELSQFENMVINIGLRMNFSNINHFQYALEPRLGVKYQASPLFAVKGSLSRYHQNMFTTYNEDDIIPLFEAWLPIQDPYIPERNDESILGFDITASEFLDFTIQGYYRKYENLLNYNNDKRKKDDNDLLQGSGKSYGFELSMKFTYDILYCMLNYSLSRAERTTGEITFLPKYDKTHSLKILAGLKLPFDIEANLYWELSTGAPFTPITSIYNRIRYDSIRDNNYNNEKSEIFIEMGKKNSERLPVYSRLDVSFSKAVNLFDNLKMKMNLDLINVYDRKNIFYFDRFTGKSIYMLPFMPTLSIRVEI